MSGAAATARGSRRTEVVSLDGSSWRLTDSVSGVRYPAAVPGSVLRDLIDAGAVEDPFYRENEQACAWVGEREWTYTRHFDVDARTAGHSRHLLRFHGLDTVASVRLNGDVILSADNMHRTWDVDVTGRLHGEGNELEVVLASPLAEIRAKQSAHPLPGWYRIMCIEGTGWLRKQLSNFGWGWGPALVTSGIWRSVELIGYDDALLTHVDVDQRHGADDVELIVRAHTDAPVPDSITMSVDVRGPDGEPVASTAGPGLERSVRITAPQLWWPRGLGEAPLYTVDVRLLGEGDAVVDSWTKRIGLRTLRLDRTADADGETFGFVCNDVPFFAKGANWIPADAVVGRATAEDLRARLQDAADAHMNMLRVWGGGIYEEDVFYDACDELGICVWQDAAFACVTFPGFDADYLDNVRIEFEQNVRRLRHHPSLALWCGNNELEMGLVAAEWTDATMSWADYTPLMDDVLADVVRRIDPDRDYWPGSPHTPGEHRQTANHPGAGDAHLWSVWHGGQSATWYRTSAHRFISEFGFESLPHPETVASFTEPEDRDLASPVMDAHQKATALGASGSAEMLRQLVQNFRTPASFDDLIWQTQLLQAAVVTTGIEHWRRSMSRTRGTLYWQLNDCWPGPSWSSVDSAGRWKALHYAVRRAYAPVLLSLVERADDGAVDVHVSNDSLDPVNVTVEWSVVHTDGQVLAAGEQATTVAGQSDAQAMTIDAKQAISAVGARNLLVFASLRERGEQRAVAAFVPPKHLSLGDPEIVVTRQSGTVSLHASKPALWAWLDAGAVPLCASDNFFCLPPGDYTVTVDIADDQPLTARSLVDTHRIAP
jgi:beta-mannosidase